MKENCEKLFFWIDSLRLRTMFLYDFHVFLHSFHTQIMILFYFGLPFHKVILQLQLLLDVEWIKLKSFHFKWLFSHEPKPLRWRRMVLCTEFSSFFKIKLNLNTNKSNFEEKRNLIDQAWINLLKMGKLIILMGYNKNGWI